MKNAILVLIGAFFYLVSSHDAVHLCGSTPDKNCARNYFRENAKCSVVQKGIDSVYYKVDLPINFANFDITEITTQTTLTGLDGEIEEFYLDEYNNLVMTVNFAYKPIYCDAPDTIFAIKQKVEEPIVFTEYINVTYPVVMTVVIPASDIITADSLRRANYFGYIPHNDATIYIGPKFSQSKDPVVRWAYYRLLSDLPLALQEILGDKTSYLFLAYLQNQICDFDISPVLNSMDLTVIDNNNEIATYKSQLYEPCDHSYDVTHCVRKFFKEHGSCAVVDHPDDEPVYRKLFSDKMPHINSTVILTDAETYGLDGKIEDFYINQQTHDLVMTVAFKGVRTDISKSHLVISQVGEPPKVISDVSSVTYPVTLTAVIPLKYGLSYWALRKAFVSSFLTSKTTFNLGPKYTYSEDPEMMQIWHIIQTNPNKIARELLLSEGPYFFISFIQKYICDYGVHL